jgi:hypothetical protein
VQLEAGQSGQCSQRAVQGEAAVYQGAAARTQVKPGQWGSNAESAVPEWELLVVISSAPVQPTHVHACR